ncbi:MULTISPECIES: aminotransferase class V-fold PLP-dependent enzyme [Gemella]|uniref:aminotransferase class V-fold PLP-dependent enzyme n=1 Tax=Gemella TaxID=1378 RepID=UPI0007684ABA|nr:MULTISPECIES: SufS family cysteine desulfurase [Gemella]AME09533.1 cysteine desulfurase [Gemella sp. oral taxon 928]AXI27171.1 SufS family cysteine desulfurase [Gemella sp. ND 6198]
MEKFSSVREDFPILKRKIGDNKLVFFDNGATTQKPIQVIDAITNYYKNYNSNIHRSVYTLGDESEKIYMESKELVKNFINAESYEEIIYTSGTTEGLNFVARMVEQELNSGDEIILSYMEHHANIVPWQQLAKRKNLVLKYLELDEKGRISINQLQDYITAKTKVVSLCHASNVLGNINPVYKIGELLKDKDIYFIVDAAQSAPHLTLDVQKMNCDFLTFSAHKMCGPTGIGVLYGKKALLEKFDPVEFGGGMIGIVEERSATWAVLPDKFEAGTPLLAQAAGLGATIKYLTNLNLENIEKYTKELTKYLYDELSKIEDIDIYGTDNINEKVSLISFNLRGVHPHDLTSFLDEKGICIRAGHQCTQLLLQKLGVYSVARVSLYFYNTKEEVDFFIKTLKETKEFFDNEF